MTFVKKIISITIISLSALNALSLNDLKSMPKSIEKDFYIWRFISSPNTDKKEVLQAAKMIYRVNGKLDKAYSAKTGMHLPKRVYKPSHADIKRYNVLIKKLKSAGSFYEVWTKLSAKDKLIVFLLAGKANRTLLDHNIDTNIIYNISKYKQINQFIFRTFREKLPKIQSSLLNFKPDAYNKISYNNLMLLGFKNLKRKNPQNAKNFFYLAISKAKSRFYADRAIFWLYMATKQRKYIEKVAKSYDFNMYKLIALDILERPYPNPSTVYIKDSQNKAINISDPIAWAKLKKKIFSKNTNLIKLAQPYCSTITAAYCYYILNKASRNTKQYFPILYKNVLKKYSIDRQAMLLALARQESHFIPASVSSSFAVGMMQFMPFLVKHIAKVRGKNVKLEDMFNPEISLKFANTHLNYLNKYLYHPLFVAYAYNAGIGYTRKLIRKNIFKLGAYEPYISLEMVDNKQANHYGKKVLANYVIYKKLLGSPVKITDLLNELPHPELTDQFRKRNKRVN